MGAGQGPADAGISRGRTYRAASRSAVPHRGGVAGTGAGRGRRRQQARRREGRGIRDDCARRRQVMSDDVPADAAPAPTRCGFVALIGAPNVGKSTLVNALVGSKVTIVSRKVQTTRALIRGIVIEDNAQIILVDTPGIFSPKRRLDRAMVSTAWRGAHDADLVCVLLDAKASIDEEADAILTKLATVQHEKILVLNKIDLVPREKLLALAKDANERLQFAGTFMVSALSGDGVDDLRRTLARMVPAGPFHYPEDQMSDAPMRHLAAEITREKIFRQLHQELPYQSTVETDSWTERKDKSIRIEQTIFV